MAKGNRETKKPKKDKDKAKTIAAAPLPERRVQYTGREEIGP